jgi:hypothetical protein
MNSPLRTKVTSDRQVYWDRPIYAEPKRPSPIEAGVMSALGGTKKAPESILLGYERELIRWMKPDGRGGLVPR